ncbi:hypothetical protein CH063_04583, partial [Colletotrichum higginsianum]
RAMLTVALDLELADELTRLNENNPSETLHRLSANLKRWSLSQSVFVFLFGIEVAQSRVAQEALKALHKHSPYCDITKLFSAFEAVSDVKTVRGKANTKHRKPVDRFKEAIGTRESRRTLLRFVFPPPRLVKPRMLTRFQCVQRLVCSTAWPNKTTDANKKSAKATNSCK